MITFSPPRTPSKSLFSKHNILSLHSIYKFHVACSVFSHFNSLLPTPVSMILHFKSEYHDYMARSRFSFSWELKWPQENLKTMLIQNLGVTNKEHNGMLWYFWSGQIANAKIVEGL